MPKFKLYMAPYGEAYWGTVNIGLIRTYGNELTISTKDVGQGKTIRYTVSPLMNTGGVEVTGLPAEPFLTVDMHIGSSSTYSFLYTAGWLRFNARSNQEDSQSKFVSFGNPTYDGTILVSRYVGNSTAQGRIWCYLVEYRGESFYYFTASDIRAGAGLIGFGISTYAFEGSMEKRYPEFTTPDPDGGYGNGETPSGDQDGTATPDTSGGQGGGGDRITVLPPNVSVDVVVNMPQDDPELPIYGQPFGNGITMAVIASVGGTSPFTALSNALWGRNQQGFEDLWTKFKDYKFGPAAGIISAFKLPFAVMNYLQGLGSEGDIPIAGTTIDGFRGLIVTGAAMWTKTYSTGAIKQFNSFRDYVGVQVRAYAPFVGWFDLDPSTCFGLSDGEPAACSIDFEYKIDPANGNVGVTIWANTVGKSDTQMHHHPVAVGCGNCAYPIALTGNDNGTSDIIGGFVQAGLGMLSAGANVAAGNIPGSISGVVGAVSGAANMILAPQHTSIVGGCGGSAGFLVYDYPFVEIWKPRYLSPPKYNSVYGRPSFAKSTVGEFAGYYAELDIHCSDIDFANDWEQQKIIDMLARGVHV